MNNTHYAFFGANEYTKYIFTDLLESNNVKVYLSSSNPFPTPNYFLLRILLSNHLCGSVATRLIAPILIRILLSQIDKSYSKYVFIFLNGSIVDNSGFVSQAIRKLFRNQSYYYLESESGQTMVHNVLTKYADLTCTYDFSAQFLIYLPLHYSLPSKLRKIIIFIIYDIIFLGKAKDRLSLILYYASESTG